jgi:hypothetical protein
MRGRVRGIVRLPVPPRPMGHGGARPGPGSAQRTGRGMTDGPIIHPEWKGPAPVPGETYDPGDWLCPPKVLADGRTLWAYRTLFGGRVCVSRTPTVDTFEDLWCYNGGLGGLTGDPRARCVAALLAWDGTGEPEGWNKHPATGRYRTDGDPLREYLEGSDEWIRGGK